MNDRESLTNNAIELVGVMDPQKKIETCREWTRVKFRALCFSLALAGYGKARVICGRRTFDEQVKLYGKGRSADELAAIGLSAQFARPKEKRVTWLQPGSSMHVGGRAIDVDLSDYEGSTLGPIEDIARQLGITWGGVWSVRDYGHFEI